jgi:hypothetical protein
MVGVWGAIKNNFIIAFVCKGDFAELVIAFEVLRKEMCPSKNKKKTIKILILMGSYTPNHFIPNPYYSAG